MTRPLAYLDGLGAGITAVATALAGWLALQTGDLAAMYASFGDAALPAVTRAVLHPAFRLGVPTALAAALVLLHVRRPHRHALLALGVVAAGLVIFWYRAAWAPLHQVAGNIK